MIISSRGRVRQKNPGTPSLKNFWPRISSKESRITEPFGLGCRIHLQVMELVAVIALAWLMGITVLLGLCRAAARGDAALMAMRAERRRAPRLMPRRRSGC